MGRKGKGAAVETAPKGKYLHETFVLRTEYYELIEHLSNEKKGVLLDMIFKYAMGESSEETDTLVSVIFIVIQKWLDSNWNYYQNTKEVRAIGGIVRALSEGQDIDQKSVELLKKRKLLTEKYLKDKGIADEVISKLIDNSQSESAIEDKNDDRSDTEDLSNIFN